MFAQHTEGIDLITHCNQPIAAPINLGTSELVSVNQLVNYIEEIGGMKLKWNYVPDAPRGVAGRNSDNTFIRQVLNWKPCTPLKTGLRATYIRIEQQYYDQKAGRRVITDSLQIFVEKN